MGAASAWPACAPPAGAARLAAPGCATRAAPNTASARTELVFVSLGGMASTARSKVSLFILFFLYYASYAVVDWM